MQLGSLELQIFVALLLVLGSAFVALVCDFLKGNNEQLRERNIELRVRQDERERMGLFEPFAHPIAWLQGLAALARNPGLAEAAAGGTATAAPAQAAPEASAPAARAEAEPDLENLTGGASTSEADRDPQRRHRYDEFKAAAKHQTWATKEELEQLAGRAARIRARHEATHRRPEEPVGLPAVTSTEMPAAAVAEVKETPRRPKVAELPRLELARAATPPAAPPSKTPKPLEAIAQAEKIVAVEVVKPQPEVVAQQPEVVELRREMAASMSPVFEDSPPPMSENPAIGAWVFKTTQQAPKTVEQSTAAAELIPSVIRPDSPSLMSTLPSPVEAVSETEAPEALALPAAETADSEPYVDIWLHPRATEPVAAEPARTRIQAIEVPLISEVVTEDFMPPPVVIAAPTAVTPTVEAHVVETMLPALGVAALQKATGDSRPTVRPATIESTGEGKLDIPAGLHEAAILSHLLENQASYSGVVVAIGLNDYDTLRDKLSSGTDSVGALNKMVLSMLRPQDFACRFQDDEYILIYPGERGSSAQRRLFQVSEKLWDFQLRSLGNLSVMFSWGGLEVTNETLSEAVASARERMYQTKRNRKPSNLDFATGRKKVVNG